MIGLGGLDSFILSPPFILPTCHAPTEAAAFPIILLVIIVVPSIGHSCCAWCGWVGGVGGVSAWSGAGS